MWLRICKIATQTRTIRIFYQENNKSDFACFTVPINSSESTLTHQSFIASVNLRASILWSGSIRSIWDQAKASNLNGKNETISRTADKYTVTLRKIGGKFVFQRINLSIISTLKSDITYVGLKP